MCVVGCWVTWQHLLCFDFTHHGPTDKRQTALCFILSELQGVDILQPGFVLVHLLVNDQFYTSGYKIQKKKTR